MVAAMVVGRITVTGIDARDVPFGTHVLDHAIERGAEIGQFHLGSTAVVLLEDSALERWLAQEGAVRYGQSVAEPRRKGVGSNGSR
jgi:phosphatidylserine decarboxylase